jgi:hypothetical protein
MEHRKYLVSLAEQEEEFKAKRDEFAKKNFQALLNQIKDQCDLA